MKTARISHFALSVLLLLLSGVASAQDYESAESAFRTAATSNNAAKRTTALGELIAFGDPAAVGVLMSEYSRVSIKIRKAQDDSYRAKYALDRIEGLIKSMELRLERDAGLANSVNTQKNKRNTLRTDYERESGVVKTWKPWRDELAAGVTTLFTGLAKGKRKKAEGSIWDIAIESEKIGERLAAIELLGHVGDQGTALEMQKLYFELISKRGRSKKQMGKLDADVREMERRMQDFQAKNQGQMTQGLAEQYDRTKRESAELRKQLTLEGYACDACIEAGGRALSREEDRVLEKSVTSLVRSLKKAKSGGYVGLLEMLGRAQVEPVRVRLRAILAEEKEPLGRATLLEALAAAGDKTLVDEIIKVHLADESWFVRSRAAAALATLRDKRGVPGLIARLAVEKEGRLRTDLATALVALTGKDYRTNVTLWQRWWKDAEATFEVPELGAVQEASAQAEDTVGLTFFGIRTESQRVLFVLDLSGSMEWSMVPRNNPDDDIQGGREPDRPQDGEVSRLTAAKQDLQKAMGGLQDDALFNVIFYASDMWAWQDNLVKMDPETRGDVTEVIEALEAVGGTNIYGALEAAFKMAGAKEGNEWVKPKVDTIFLLSDGKPSVGISVDPDEILAMVREANENAGITVHTIGLSGAQDAYLLRTLAEENGGTYAAR